MFFLSSFMFPPPAASSRGGEGAPTQPCSADSTDPSLQARRPSCMHPDGTHRAAESHRHRPRRASVAPQAGALRPRLLHRRSWIRDDEKGLHVRSIEVAHLLRSISVMTCARFDRVADVLFETDAIRIPTEDTG